MRLTDQRGFIAILGPRSEDDGQGQNAGFDKLTDQIDIEADAAKRKALIRQAETVMETAPRCCRPRGRPCWMSGTTT